MKGKLHTIPSAKIFNESDDTELANSLGIADVLDSRWGFGRFQGVFDESTKKPSSGQCVFEEARYFGELDENADFSGQGILMFDDGGFASGTFKNGEFQHGILHFVESKMTAIIREYLDDGKTWLGTIFYDEDGGWADGVFGEDWNLLEGDEFDSEGNFLRRVDEESDKDDG